MRHFRQIIFFIFLLISVNLSAQEPPNFHFRRYQVNEGLSENAVYCILQDARGFMWFGTKDGLNRFDGSRFRIFRNKIGDKNTIGNNFIRSLAEGADEILFVGTDIGLYVMEGADESFKLVDSETTEHVKIHSAINSLLLDKNGCLWIGTMLQGVFVYDTKTKKIRQIESSNPAIKPITTWCIYQDKSDVVWAGTRQGLLRYNTDTDRLEPLNSLFSKSASSNETLSMLEDIQGELWIGTWDDGLHCYNKYSNTYETYLGKDSKTYITHIRTLFQYNKQTLLVGSDDGLFLFDTKTRESKRIDAPNSSYSLSDQNVYSITKDRENGIWIGTYFGGVNYLNPSLTNMEFYNPNNTSNALQGKAISQFIEDANSNLWIATEDGGVHHFDVQTRKFTRPIQTSYHNTHALLLDGDNLWIGTFSRGVDIYNQRTRKRFNLRNRMGDKHSLSDDCVFSIYKTIDGTIYVGTPAGLNCYNRQTTNFNRIPEISAFVYDMLEDKYGNLWVATYGNGIVKRDAKTKKWICYNTLFPASNPIVNSKLTSLYIDSQHRLWVASEGRGIFLYDYLSNTFKNISEVDGLPNNVVYGILDDQYGNLWVSCNKGLIRFNPSKLKGYELYSTEDGLQSNQFNYKSSFKAKDGKLYFGGINGFNCFYPQELKKNEIIPPVEITEVRLLGKSTEAEEHQLRTSVNEKKTICLPYNRSSFTISYISLSFDAQTKNQYAYMLEGADKAWNMVGNNKSVTYVNLPPGKYKFRVKASNNDGLWNTKGGEIKIEIRPPFWLSIYAKLFYLIALIMVTTYLFRYYHRRNVRKQEHQLEAFKLEQETAAFKSKIDFFTTIAHEIRTPLSLIKAPLEEIVISDVGNRNTKQNLSIIEKNTDRLTVLINQLLDFRKMDSTNYVVTPERVDLVKFILNIYERFRKTAQNKKIKLELQLPNPKELFAVSDVDALTKIITNLLTNALKFTNNKIVLSLTANNESYNLSVEDNGLGVPDNLKSRIFEPFYQIQNPNQNIGTGIGLSLVKHLSEILHGTLCVNDVPPGGSVFSFIFSDLPMNITPQKEFELIVPSVHTEMHDSKPTILIIDDNTEILQFIQSCFENDYTTDVATGATEAFRLLEKNAYKLIITDIMMPDIDGITLTRMIKQDANYSHIPILLLSARTNNGDKILGLEAGADVFIEKPFSTTHLKAQIESLLANRNMIVEAFNKSPLASYSMLASSKEDEIFLTKLNKMIELHLTNTQFSVESLTEELCISRSNFQRKLKTICDVTPGDYLRNYRLKKACQLLLESDARINEVAFEAGFNSASYFTKCFLKQYGILPKEFVKQHKKM